MDKINHSFTTITVLAIISFGALLPTDCWSFFKDPPSGYEEGGDNPSPRNYLAFQSPPRLFYSSPVPVADRGNLFMLREITPAVEEDFIESNSSMEESFPVIDLATEETNSSVLYQIPSSYTLPNEEQGQGPALPPADPFVPQDANQLESINSTDELFRLFERDSAQSSQAGSTSFQFFPPFTIDRGNMTLGSRASYTRKQR